MVKFIFRGVTVAGLKILYALSPALGLTLIAVVPSIAFTLLLHNYDIDQSSELIKVGNVIFSIVGFIVALGMSNKKMPPLTFTLTVIASFIFFNHNQVYRMAFCLLSLVLIISGFKLLIENGPKKSTTNLLKQILPKVVLRFFERVSRKSNSFYLTQEWVMVRNQRRLIDGEKCWVCGENRRFDHAGNTIQYEVDHILPRHHFPELALELLNTAVACKSCNGLKKANFGEREVNFFINNVIAKKGASPSLEEYYYQLLDRIPR